VSVECRAAEDGPMLHGVVLAEGRAATGGRAELFAPGAVTWPPDGIGIAVEHHGRAEVRAVPTRDAEGRIRVQAPATPAIFQAVQSGRRWLSVEFYSLREARTAGGVREIQRALVDQAALVSHPEYAHAQAEVRARRRVFL
ncbi:MAG: hypothetical protein OXI80_12180, partial [Caldilineaceae bacterium]|nr:hypothetical protein [Caldilineaceae bacterium]